jgi:hypothetical protein
MDEIEVLISAVELTDALPSPELLTHVKGFSLRLTSAPPPSLVDALVQSAVLAWDGDDFGLDSFSRLLPLAVGAAAARALPLPSLLTFGTADRAEAIRASWLGRRVLVRLADNSMQLLAADSPPSSNTVVTSLRVKLIELTTVKADALLQCSADASTRYALWGASCLLATRAERVIVWGGGEVAAAEFKWHAATDEGAQWRLWNAERAAARGGVEESSLTEPARMGAAKLSLRN